VIEAGPGYNLTLHPESDRAIGEPQCRCLAGEQEPGRDGPDEQHSVSSPDLIARSAPGRTRGYEREAKGGT